jgi:hypothetical protein
MGEGPGAYKKGGHNDGGCRSFQFEAEPKWKSIHGNSCGGTMSIIGVGGAKYFNDALRVRYDLKNAASQEISEGKSCLCSFWGNYL